MVCYAVAFHMAYPSKPPLHAERPSVEVSEQQREEPLRQHEAGIRAAVEGLSVESVAQKMSGLGLEISRALNGRTEQGKPYSPQR